MRPLKIDDDKIIRFEHHGERRKKSLGDAESRLSGSVSKREIGSTNSTLTLR